MCVYIKTDTFYDDIPKSVIVYADRNSDILRKYKTYNNNIDLSDDNTVLKIKAYELYSKYISNGSEYQINISYGVSNEFDTYFDDFDALLAMNITEDEICKLFIEPIIEIKKLLKQTFARYCLLLKSVHHL